LAGQVGNKRRVLVLGAYGLIGSAITQHLLSQGHQIKGLGRNCSTANRIFPQIEWVVEDLANLTSSGTWIEILNDVDIVVNCAGALQDGANDKLDVVHHEMIRALVQAAERKSDVDLIQISAVRASENASTSFMRSKAAGDRAIRASSLDWWISHPGMVIGRNSYGGSTLLRMLAAVPLVQPLALDDARIQTVSLDELAITVGKAVSGEIEAGTEFDLVEADSHSLSDLVSAFRNWLGFMPARLTFRMPRWFVSFLSVFVDLLGLLGWRSPLRSSAVTALSSGIVGNQDERYQFRSLGDTLGGMPVNPQDRWFARMSLIFPVAIVVLFVFWLVSGLVGVLSLDGAAAVLTRVGWETNLAKSSVLF
jgi:uncharacterized protein YbjT (DUF2867 family)